MKIKYLPYLCFLFLMFGCSQIKQRKINLEELQIANVKMETTNDQDSCAIVDILNYFPNIEKCESNKQFANLYVCKQELTGDTIYVFADCEREKTLPFFKGVYLEKNSITNKVVKELVVSIPENFIIPKKAKYVFSDLLWLVD